MGFPVNYTEGCLPKSGFTDVQKNDARDFDWQLLECDGHHVFGELLGFYPGFVCTNEPSASSGGDQVRTGIQLYELVAATSFFLFSQACLLQ